MQPRLLLAAAIATCASLLNACDEAWVPQYMSEYYISGTGKPRSVECNAVSQKPRTSLDQLGRRIQWVHSYLTRDRVYYGYRVPDEAFERAAAVAYFRLASS